MHHTGIEPDLLSSLASQLPAYPEVHTVLTKDVITRLEGKVKVAI